MHEIGPILLNIFLLFAVARAAGILFERLRLPAVIGEIIAGVIIGPSVLGLVESSIINEVLATLGVIVLLFTVGLETKVSDLSKVGGKASIVALLGILLPFTFTFMLLYYLRLPILSSLFVATATVATSVGITARILSELGVVSRIESKIILGAAVLDDIIGLLIISILVTYARTQTLYILDFLLVLVQIIAFVLFASIIAPWLVRKRPSLIKRVKINDSALTISLIVMLGLSAVSNYLGLAAIVGAFFAGMIFAETDDCERLNRELHTIYEFLVPFFFIVTGIHVDMKIFADPMVLRAAPSEGT